MMSLINKMLNDLEKRDAFLEENQDRVLDGLYSAYDVELTKNKTSHTSFLIALLFFISLAAIFYLYSGSINFVLSNYLNEETVIAVSVDNQKTVNTSLGVQDEELMSESSTEPKPFLKLDDSLIVKIKETETQTITEEENNRANTQKYLNRIDQISFKRNENTINLFMKMPKDIDYLVYSLSNPNRIVIEVNDAELGFRLEELEPVDPIVAIRYSINQENRFKLVLESDEILNIKKSVTSKGNEYHDLVVVMEHDWQSDVIDNDYQELLHDIVEKQVEQEKQTVFKGELVKTPVNNNNAYAEKLFKQAYAEHKRGEITNSLRNLNKVLDIEPGHVNARSTLALTLSKQGHTDLAYSVLNEGLIQFPQQAEWLKMTARLMLNEGKIVQAGELLSSHSPSLSENVDYYALFAAVLQKLNDHQKSAKVYRDLLKTNPLNSVWWMGLGISLESLKRYQDALYAYQKAYNSPSLASDSKGFVSQRISLLNNLLKDEST